MPEVQPEVQLSTLLAGLSLQVEDRARALRRDSSSHPLVALDVVGAIQEASALLENLLHQALGADEEPTESESNAIDSPSTGQYL